MKQKKRNLNVWQKKSESPEERINEIKKGYRDDEDLQNLSEDEVKVLHRKVFKNLFSSLLNTAADILTRRGEQRNADLLKK